MYDENFQSSRYENSSVIPNYPISQRKINRAINNFEEKDQISQKSNKTRDFSNTSVTTQQSKKVVIKLPSYIINSHPISKKSSQDISEKYNILLVSPENERLYIANHYALLQVMTQYVYYRKLCVWIKEELAKKRLELLEIARNALINARDSNIYSLEHMSDSELTVDEKKSLMKYTQEAMDQLSVNHDNRSSCQQNSNENKSIHLERSLPASNPNTPSVLLSSKDSESQKCPNQIALDMSRHSKEMSSSNQVDYCKNPRKNSLQNPDQNSDDEDCDFCPSNLDRDFRIQRQRQPSCTNELYICDKCGSNKFSKGKSKFKMEVDRGTNPEHTCVLADSCCCHSEKNRRLNMTHKKCCVIL